MGKIHNIGTAALVVLALGGCAGTGGLAGAKVGVDLTATMAALGEAAQIVDSIPADAQAACANLAAITPQLQAGINAANAVGLSGAQVTKVANGLAKLNGLCAKSGTSIGNIASAASATLGLAQALAGVLGKL